MDARGGTPTMSTAAASDVAARHPHTDVPIPQASYSPSSNDLGVIRRSQAISLILSPRVNPLSRFQLQPLTPLLPGRRVPASLRKPHAPVIRQRHPKSRSEPHKLILVSALTINSRMRPSRLALLVLLTCRGPVARRMRHCPYSSDETNVWCPMSGAR